jgi:hypothetical protein
MKCKVCKEKIEIHDYDAGFAFNAESPMTFRNANFHSYCYELETEGAKQTESKKVDYENRHDEYLHGR